MKKYRIENIEADESVFRNLEEMEDVLSKSARGLPSYGAVGVKGGFEAEGQGMDEITYMEKLDPINLPITCKIGGPEAVNDVRLLKSRGINRIQVPMVRECVDLKKIVQTVQDTGDNNQSFEICINLESNGAYKSRKELLECPEISYVSKVNVGKSDFGLSAGLSANDEEILRLSRLILLDAREKNLRCGVGGSIVPSCIDRVIYIIEPDEIETRHVIFSVDEMTNPQESIRAALDFELLFHKVFIKKLNQDIRQIEKNVEIAYFESTFKEIRKRQLQKRIQDLQARLMLSNERTTTKLAISEVMFW